MPTDVQLERHDVTPDTRPTRLRRFDWTGNLKTSKDAVCFRTAGDAFYILINGLLIRPGISTGASFDFFRPRESLEDDKLTLMFLRGGSFR